jgi:hypothetical protein
MIVTCLHLWFLDCGGFAARRLRNPALADTLIDPLMAGIYAGTRSGSVLL